MDNKKNALSEDKNTKDQLEKIPKRESQTKQQRFPIDTGWVYDGVAPKSQEKSSVKVPNKITRRAMEDVEKGRNLKTYASIDEMLEDLDI